MFAPDLAAALSGTRRVLRVGGGFALIAWSTPERTPFHATPLTVLRALGRPAPPDAELVRAFSFAPGVLSQALAGAGFRDVVAEPVPAPRRHASAGEAIAFHHSRPLARVMAYLDDSVCVDAWTEIERAYRGFEAPSGVAFPGEVLVVAATG